MFCTKCAQNFFFSLAALTWYDTVYFKHTANDISGDLEVVDTERPTQKVIVIEFLLSHDCIDIFKNLMLWTEYLYPTKLLC